MPSKEFSFELITQDEKKARLGKIYTQRGSIDTPAFENANRGIIPKAT